MDINYDTQKIIKTHFFKVKSKKNSTFVLSFGNKTIKQTIT